MKVLTLYDKSGPKYHRCLLPLYLMDGVELVVNHSIDQDQLKDIDVLYFNRFPPKTSIKELIELREKYGFKIIVDNDDYWYLDPLHPMYGQYEYLGIPDWITDCILIADACTVTHERLAERVKEINPKCSHPT